MPVFQDPKFDAKIAEWLKKYGKAPCFTCGAGPWAIGQLIAAPRFLLNPTRLHSEHRIMVPLTCMNCGTIKLFDPSRVGAKSEGLFEGSELIPPGGGSGQDGGAK